MHKQFLSYIKHIQSLIWSYIRFPIIHTCIFIEDGEKIFLNVSFSIVEPLLEVDENSVIVLLSELDDASDWSAAVCKEERKKYKREIKLLS